VDIVFDFGNVLFEWNPASLLEQHFSGTDQIEPDYVALAIAMTTHPDWLEFDAGRLDGATLAARVAARLHLDVDAVRTFLTRVPHVLPPIESAVEIVERLCADRSDKHRVFYLSNMPAEFADTLEKKYPWIAKFQGGVFSARVGLLKPDLAIYLHTQTAFGLHPANTLFLDDSSANVSAARECGWHAEQILDASSIGRALAAHGVQLF
jgi:putative hydrolase of the HAD superfamily